MFDLRLRNTLATALFSASACAAPLAPEPTDEQKLVAADDNIQLVEEAGDGALDAPSVHAAFVKGNSAYRLRFEVPNGFAEGNEVNVSFVRAVSESDATGETVMTFAAVLALNEPSADPTDVHSWRVGFDQGSIAASAGEVEALRDEGFAPLLGAMEIPAQALQSQAAWSRWAACGLMTAVTVVLAGLAVSIGIFGTPVASTIVAMTYSALSVGQGATAVVACYEAVYAE